MRMYVVFMSILMVLGIGIPTYAHAQLFDFSSSLGDVEFILDPQYPQPNKSIRATIQSAGETLETASIVWLLNGEIQQQSIGGTTFQFTSSNEGSEQSLSVFIRTSDGRTLSQNSIIRPSSVVLVWEADTFTPPFYKGRALYTSGARIRAEALTQFRDATGVIPPESLFYTWTRNGSVIQSGVGKQYSILFTEGPKFLGTDILSVTVSTADDLYVAQSTVRIETNEPRIQLYTADALLGTLYHSVFGSNLLLSGANQLEIQAVPFFMSAGTANSDLLEYQWTLQGKRLIPSINRPSFITLQTNNIVESGSAAMRLVVEHTRNLLQSGEKNVTIDLEATRSNGLFGI